MDVGRYRHNYEGFHEKTSFQMSINRGGGGGGGGGGVGGGGGRPQVKVLIQALWEFSPFFSLSLGEEL